MLKISELPSPAIAGVIRSKTKNQAIAGIKNCVYDGATMIDLHLSCLENADVQTLRDIFASTRLPVLALNYNQKCDWSDAGYTEEQRVHSLFTAVEAGAAGVDMQVLLRNNAPLSKEFMHAAHRCFFPVIQAFF